MRAIHLAASALALTTATAVVACGDDGSSTGGTLSLIHI